MDNADLTRTRWTLFARELRAILEKRGLGLGHLDDRRDSQGRKIHREKVRLLRQSLQEFSRTTLSSEEMDIVIDAFRLNDGEILRLRAAIFVIYIEAMLEHTAHIPQVRLLISELLDNVGCLYHVGRQV